MSELKRLSLTCEFGDPKDSLIRDRIVVGVLSDQLRGEFLKNPDLTLQGAHDYCRTFEAAEQQKFKFHVPTSAVTERSSGIQSVKKSNGQGLHPARWCKFCGYKHPFNQPNKCPAFGKKCMKCKKEGHFAQVFKEIAKKGSQVDTVEQENSFDEDCQCKSEDVHTYFGSVELGTVSDNRKRNKSSITLEIAGRDVRIKADTGAEATVIPYNLYTQITKKPLQKIHQPLKGWLAKKPIPPKDSVSLPTQFKNRKLDVLYLVVKGDFTPLLGCDACLDLEVIKFMNIQLIDTPEPHVGNSETSRQDEDQSIFETDPVLREYQYCFSDKPGKLPTKVHLEIDPSVPPVVQSPRKIPIALLESAQEKLKVMEEDGTYCQSGGTYTLGVMDQKLRAVLDKSREVGLKFNPH